MRRVLPLTLTGLLLGATVGLTGWAAPAAAQDSLDDSYVTLKVESMPLSEVVSVIAAEAGININAHREVADESITITLNNEPIGRALEVIARAHDLALERIDDSNFLFVPAKRAGRSTSGVSSVLGGTVSVGRATTVQPEVRLPAGARREVPPAAGVPVPLRAPVRPHSPEPMPLADASKIGKVYDRIELKHANALDVAAMLGQPAYVTDMNGQRRWYRPHLDLPSTVADIGSPVGADRWLDRAVNRGVVDTIKGLYSPHTSLPNVGFGVRDQFGEEAGGGGLGGAGAAGGAGGQGVFQLPEGVDTVIGYDLLSALIVYGTPDGIAELRALVEFLDQPPAQIEIEARFVSLTVGEADSFGINWTLTDGYTTVQTQLPSQGASVAVQVARGNFQALLTALERNNNAKLVNAPRVATQNGQPATVAFQQTIPVLISDTVITDASQTVATEIVAVPVTTQLFVVPRVTGQPPNESITTIILPQVADVTGFVDNPAGGQIPIIATQFVQTMVRVQDGETIAMGGLIRKNNSESVNKIPLLGDLPFIGGLFRSRTRTIDESELLIFLTPKIIREPTEAGVPTAVR